MRERDVILREMEEVRPGPAEHSIVHTAAVGKQCGVIFQVALVTPYQQQAVDKLLTRRELGLSPAATAATPRWPGVPPVLTPAILAETSHALAYKLSGGPWVVLEHAVM